MVERSIRPEEVTEEKRGGRRFFPKELQYRGPEVYDYEWGGAFEGWARGFVSRNLWRTAHLHGSHEDAMQECALIFLRCCRNYSGPAKQPKRMMAYFKLAVTNEWNTIAVKDRRQRDMLAEPAQDAAEDAAGVDFNYGPLAAALSKGSAELRSFLGMLHSAPADFLDMIFADEDVARLNIRIRRALRIKDQAVDIVGELRTLLS